MNHVWKILRYARQKVNKCVTDSIEWEYYDDKQCVMELSLTKGTLLLTRDKSIMESYQLSNAINTLRGISKGDSLLLVYRVRNTTHRFRVKFSEGEEGCKRCTEVLSSSFPVKRVSYSCDDSKQDERSKGEDKARVLEGEVTLSQIAKNVTVNPKEKLPRAYNAVRSISNAQLNLCIKLCLADPEFPSFVQQVEKEMLNIRNEHKN